MAQVLQTEFDFTLPRGYVDADGNLHRRGVMRLAKARDEIEPLADSRGRANESYLAILLLSRVVTRLGDISPISPAVIEDLFSSDFAFLQDLYLRLNDDGSRWIATECPNCKTRFELDLLPDGESESMP
ncbi:MAG: hypothetical protein AB7P14_20540 [Blastocatellales bacterium]